MSIATQCFSWFDSRFSGFGFNDLLVASGAMPAAENAPSLEAIAAQRAQLMQARMAEISTVVSGTDFGAAAELRTDEVNLQQAA